MSEAGASRLRGTRRRHGSRRWWRGEVGRWRRSSGWWWRRGEVGRCAGREAGAGHPLLLRRERDRIGRRDARARRRLVDRRCSGTRRLLPGSRRAFGVTPGLLRRPRFDAGHVQPIACAAWRRYPGLCGTLAGRGHAGVARRLPELPAALVAGGDSGASGYPGGRLRCPAARRGRIWLASSGVPLGCRLRPPARRDVCHGLAGRRRGHLRGGPDDRGWLLRPGRFGGRGWGPGRLGWAAAPWLRLRHPRIRGPLRRSGSRVRLRRLSGTPRGCRWCAGSPGGPGRGWVRGGRRGPAQIRLPGGVPAVLPCRPVAVWRRSASARRRLFRLLAGVVRAFGRHACASSISFGRGRRCATRQPASPDRGPRPALRTVSGPPQGRFRERRAATPCCRAVSIGFDPEPPCRIGGRRPDTTVPGGG